eukprot:jgi/Hompol1/6104/HPOL_002171-RA
MQYFQGGQSQYLETYGEESRLRDPSIEQGPRRVFKPKETYKPRDLNDRNVAKFAKTLDAPPTQDVLKRLGIDPLKDYKNINMLSHFITTIGHIKPRVATGLDSRNQRRVARAIKRARAMGLMPYTYSILRKYIDTQPRKKAARPATGNGSNRYLQQRVREQRKIQEENRRLVKKIESVSTKSAYSKKSFDKEWVKNRKIVARMSTHVAVPTTTRSRNSLAQQPPSIASSKSVGAATSTKSAADSAEHMIENEKLQRHLQNEQSLLECLNSKQSHHTTKMSPSAIDDETLRRAFATMSIARSADPDTIDSLNLSARQDLQETSSDQKPAVKHTIAAIKSKLEAYSKKFTLPITNTHRSAFIGVTKSQQRQSSNPSLVASVSSQVLQTDLRSAVDKPSVSDRAKELLPIQSQSLGIAQTTKSVSFAAKLNAPGGRVWK